MKRLPHIFALIACLIFASPAMGDVSLSGLDPIVVNAWSGATSDLVGSDIYCSVSCTGACRRSSHRADFDSAFYSDGGTDWSGNFYIRNGGDTMLVYVDWTHPVAGTTRMTNYNRTFQTTPVTEGGYSCADPVSQTRIDITLPAAELATARAGTYSETFRIDACRLNNNGSLAECAAQVSFSVTLPELVQITRLANLNLGTWNGVSDIQVTEDFCVFRNGQGGFSMVTSGSNDSGGQFNLQSATSIPYTIEYSQGGPYYPVTPGSPLTSGTSGFGGDPTRDCGGANNTTMRVTVDAAVLAAQPGGNFSDTLVIYVEPN